MVWRSSSHTQRKALVEQESCEIRNRQTNIKHVIAREIKSAVKGFIKIHLTTMVEGSLDDTLRISHDTLRTGIRVVFHNVFEQIILDLFREDVLDKMLDTHMAKYFDMNAAGEGLLRRLLPSTSSMAPLASFVWRKTETAVNEKR